MSSKGKGHVGLNLLRLVLLPNMKLVLVPILIMLVLTQTFSKWLVILEYKLNQDFISQNLCENKARPRLHCNGKCQMMKKIAEEEKQQSTTKAAKIKSTELLYVHHTTLPWIENEISSSQQVYNSRYLFSDGKGLISPVFRPPLLS